MVETITKTIEWDRESKPYPNVGMVIKDFFGAKWKVTSKHGLTLTLEMVNE